MYRQTGNLSGGERSISALAGAASLLAATRAPFMWRSVLALGGLALIARAAAGHCAVKSVLRGDAARFERKSRAIDESVEQSFPASDPPASRLPDEPPVNAEAKWRAAAAAASASS